VVEAGAGLWAGSLALLGDAGHMAADAAGLGLALAAEGLSSRGPSRRYTFGLKRVEVVAAVANALLLLGAVAWIAVEAVRRLGTTPEVHGGVTAGVAALGCVVNVIVARTLARGGKTLNVRAALLHVLGDLLGSVGALVAGGVVLLTGWTPIDPILSLGICALILVSAARVLRDGGRILLEGVPAHLSVEEVGRALAGVEGVASVHDLHLWQLSSTDTSLSAHVVLEDAGAWEGVLLRCHAVLAERFGIDHATLQPERRPAPVRLE
jgi:cobalt-zinc-cadmium efflux system protein